MSLYDEILKAENRSADFSKIFDRITIGKNFLGSCTFELTPLCNFSCPFCYARMSENDMIKKGVSTLNFDVWKRYIDDLAEMNCMTVSFTGGECTFHPDFVRIYRYAYSLGFLINVYTNGSHITNEMIETFCEMPPARFFITVYGASPDMYGRVTGKKDAYYTVTENIKKLVSLKFDVVLQGTFYEENVADMERLYDFASELGCEYKFSTQLHKFGNCTDEIIDGIRAEAKLANKLSQNIMNRKKGLPPDAQPSHDPRIVKPLPHDPNAVGIKCNAGKNSCFIRHDGVMMACNTFDAYTVKIGDRSIKDCFAELNAWASNLERISECEGCIHAIHCTTCVAAHYNDTHKLGVPSPRICYKIREPEKARAEREFFDKHGYIEI